MMATDLWIVDDNIIGDVTPNGDDIFIQLIRLIGLRSPAHYKAKAIKPLHNHISPVPTL
jgi:hypothetical protein